jgi:hypothetical protein
MIVLVSALAVSVVSGGIVFARHGFQSNETGADEYLRAYDEVLRSERAGLPAIHAAVAGYAADVGRACRGAVADAPTRIERERRQTATSAEASLSEEVLDAVALTAWHGLMRVAWEHSRSAAVVVRSADWSDMRLTLLQRLVQEEQHAWAALGRPDVCQDIVAWASGGFKELPANADGFLRRWHAIERKATNALDGPNRIAITPASLRRLILKRLKIYENDTDASFARHAEALETELEQAIRSTVLRGAGDIWLALGLSR